MNINLKDYYSIIYSEKEFIKNPLTSVILVCYNQEQYLDQAFQSIVNSKTKFKFEILITDDFSNDNSIEILKVLQQQYPSLVKLLTSKENLSKYGSPGSLNTKKAYLEAKGKYIALCEGDDYWTDPYKLQKQVDYLEANPNCSICTHWVKTKDESGQGIHEDAFSSKGRKSPLYKNDLFENKNGSSHGTAYHPLSWVFRSALVKHIPKWIYPIRGCDDVLFTEFLQHGYCYCIPEFMGTYRITKKSSWAPLSPMIKTLAQIHFLINVRMHYANYHHKVNKILENHLINLQNWKINRADLTKLLKELFKIFRNDQKSTIPILNFYTKVFLHQFYYNSIGLIKIKIGKFRNMYFRNV